MFYILKDTQIPTGVAQAHAYANSLTFDVHYDAFDTGPSGLKFVKLYYTLQTAAPYTWTLYITTTVSPISFAATTEGRYGFKIIAYDFADNTDEPDPPSTTTPPETHTLCDITAPTITDNQPGDDIWRNAPGTLYNIDFADTGSRLDSAQYIIRSGPSATDTILKDWTYIFISTNVETYSLDWPIDFGACKSSWNYVSVRVWDIAGTTTTLPNAFYVKKDTIQQ